MKYVIPRFDDFLLEGFYDSRIPHWIRLDKSFGEKTYSVHYGFVKVGNIDSEIDFFNFLREHGIKFKKTGLNKISLSEEMTSKLKTVMKPAYKK